MATVRNNARLHFFITSAAEWGGDLVAAHLRPFLLIVRAATIAVSPIIDVEDDESYDPANDEEKYRTKRVNVHSPSEENTKESDHEEGDEAAAAAPGEGLAGRGCRRRRGFAHEQGITFEYSGWRRSRSQGGALTPIFPF